LPVYLNKLENFYKENGFLKTFFWLLLKTLKNGIFLFFHPRTCYIIEKDLTTKLFLKEAKLEVTYKQLKDFDSAYLHESLSSSQVKLFRNRFKRGQLCIACFTGKKMIGYKWVSFVPENDRHIGITITPKHNESYGFDLHVAPEYRQYQIGFALISRWLQFSKKSGKTKAIGIVDKTNKPMLMTTKIIFGFKVIEFFRSLELFRWRGFIISKTVL
jgi:ribosomal protein S18 acetylase RimI-like enzyme